jgi:hypothetical protein
MRKQIAYAVAAATFIGLAMVWLTPSAVATKGQSHYFWAHANPYLGVQVLEPAY